MENILVFFKILLVLLILGGLSWGGYELYKLLEGKNTSDTTNVRLQHEIDSLSDLSENLQPLIKKYQHQVDSMSVIDSIYDIKITSLKNENSTLERKLLSSKDSANKYKNSWKQSLKKYKELKESQKEPSNQETLDFFKKH